MGLTSTEWTCEHQGHLIRVVHSWFAGAKLYVDGERRDTSIDLFCVDDTRPLLSCALVKPGGDRSIVEVYLVAPVRTRAMICVDGTRVGGDLVGPGPRSSQDAPPLHYRAAAPARTSAEVVALQRSLANARTLNVTLAVALGAAVAAAAASWTRPAPRCEPARVAPVVLRVASPPIVDQKGCADGARESFRDVARYPRIAGCAGGFDVAGLGREEGPACGRRAGDDGANPDGRGCRADDLCAAGWHVCRSSAEVAARSPDGCVGARDAAPASFFATRQLGPGCRRCATGAATDCGSNDCRDHCAPTAAMSNDLFGCGTLGSAPDPATCGVLDRFSDNLCSGLQAPWRCDGDAAGVRERELVVKPGPGAGGVLCCAD